MCSQHRWPCWLFWQPAISTFAWGNKVLFCSVLFAPFPKKRRYPSKIANFSHPRVLIAPDEGVLLGIWCRRKGHKSLNDGLPDGRKSFKIGLVVLIQYRLWQTDRHPASNVAIATRSSADADNGLDAFSGQSRSTNMVPFWVHCDFSLSMWSAPADSLRHFHSSSVL